MLYFPIGFVVAGHTGLEQLLQEHTPTSWEISETSSARFPRHFRDCPSFQSIQELERFLQMNRLLLDGTKVRCTLYDYGDFGGMAGDRHLSYGTVPVCKLGSEMENYEETRQMDFAQVPAHHAASHPMLSPLAPKTSDKPTPPHLLLCF